MLIEYPLLNYFSKTELNLHLAPLGLPDNNCWTQIHATSSNSIGPFFFIYPDLDLVVSRLGFDTELEAEGFSSGSTRGTIQRSSNQQPIREKITETDEGESGYKKGETKEKKRHT